jgi:hypothetical protein
MKLILLLAALVVLSGCTTQQIYSGIPLFESETAQQCARNCEYVHGGTVRACSASRSGASRGETIVARCVNKAYEELRICYWKCGTPAD